MAVKKTNHFKDDIRRTFIAYAFLPILLISAAVLCMIAVYWNTSICKRNENIRAGVCETLEQLVTVYASKADEAAALCDLQSLVTDKTASRELSESLYKFSNHSPGKADFYILDVQMNLISSSAVSAPAFLQMGKGATWGVVARMRATPAQPAFDFINTVGGYGRPMDLAVGKAVTERGKITGYVLFVIPGAYFSSFAENLPAHIVVTDRFDYTRIAGDAAYSDQLGHLKAEIRSAGRYFVFGHEQYYQTRETILGGEMTVYALTPVSATITYFKIAAVILAVVLMIVGTAIIFGARRLAADKTKIIDQLVDAFEKVRCGNLDTHLSINSNDEFEIIGDSYNIMLASLKDLIRTNNEKARQTVLSEIRQLESQFNPHFLFNTLENIKFMVKLDPDAATRMIVSLSTLLRYSINTKVSEITLREDIDYTQSYLDILKYRFGARLNYVIDEDPDTRDCIVPKLIIQPIIENAIKYGFEGRQHLLVEVSAQLGNGVLLLSIHNDGAPMDEKTLAAVRALLASSEREQHIGLYYVHRRIRLLYGGDFGMEVDSGPEHGTEVRLTLPILHKGDSHAEIIDR